MSLREEIRALYRDNPNISGEEVRQRLGQRSRPEFWRILQDEQLTMRGVYAAKRKNRSKRMIMRDKGLPS